MNNEIEEIKNILINVYEDECGFNEGCLTSEILYKICDILDDIKFFIIELEDIRKEAIHYINKYRDDFVCDQMNAYVLLNILNEGNE